MLSLDKITEDFDKKKNIIFIPFSVTEDNFSLYIRSLYWRDNLRVSNKNEKIPDVVMYRHPDELDEDYENYDVQYQFSSENLAANTTIYVLADGMGDPNCITNVNRYFYEMFSDSPYVLPIDAVVWRMKQCGLTPELAQNLQAIKLFICEEGDNSNLQMTVNFAHGLGELYSDVSLNYYRAAVYIPSFASEDIAKTNAKKVGKIYSKNNGVEQLIESGVLSQYRQALTVEKALQMDKSENYDGDLLALQTTKAWTMFASHQKPHSLTEQFAGLSIEECTGSLTITDFIDEGVQASTAAFEYDADDVEAPISTAVEVLIEDPVDEPQTTQCTAIILYTDYSNFRFFSDYQKQNTPEALSISNPFDIV